MNAVSARASGNSSQRKLRQLVAERAEVGPEPEPEHHGHRQRGGEDQPALQVNARIAAAVTIQPATVSMIGTSLSSTCSGSSPTS